VDPSPKNYYERQTQRKKEKIEARKKESKWLPHDNAEKKQGAQPTAESQPVPTAGVDLSSTDRSRPPTDDPQQTQENANGAAEQKKDGQPSPPAEQQPGPPAGVDLSSKNPPKTGGSQATGKNAQPSRPAGNQSGGLRGSQFAYEYVPHVRPTAEQPIPTVGVDLSSEETPKAQPGLGVSKFADPNRVPHVRPTAERPIPAVEADLSSPKTPGQGSIWAPQNDTKKEQEIQRKRPAENQRLQPVPVTDEEKPPRKGKGPQTDTKGGEKSNKTQQPQEGDKGTKGAQSTQAESQPGPATDEVKPKRERVRPGRGPREKPNTAQQPQEDGNSTEGGPQANTAQQPKKDVDSTEAPTSNTVQRPQEATNSAEDPEEVVGQGLGDSRHAPPKRKSRTVKKSEVPGTTEGCGSTEADKVRKPRWRKEGKNLDTAQPSQKDDNSTADAPSIQTGSQPRPKNNPPRLKSSRPRPNINPTRSKINPLRLEVNLLKARINPLRSKANLATAKANLPKAKRRTRRNCHADSGGGAIKRRELPNARRKMLKNTRRVRNSPARRQKWWD
jgi:hypothetical protein